jgi:2-dehydropantoate 2-reductase
MRILVMGAGGVGGYYGALLARAGNEVTFVARGAHLEAIQERGIEVRALAETFRVAGARAVESPTSAAGPFDLVLFAVKNYDTTTAAAVIEPVVGPQTAVLTLQNGVDAPDILGRALGMDRILAGVTFVSASIAEPGVIQESGFSRKVIFGEPAGGEITPRVRAIEHVFREAGMDVEMSVDARQTLWDKFVVVVPHATISALCQTPIGVTRQTPEAMDLYHRMIQEAIAVGEASGMTFAPDLSGRILASFLGAPENQMSSLQRDYAAQRRVELEALPGTVVHRAKELGVATPCFDALYAILKVRATTFGGLT